MPLPECQSRRWDPFVQPTPRHLNTRLACRGYRRAYRLAWCYIFTWEESKLILVGAYLRRDLSRLDLLELDGADLRRSACALGYDHL